MTKVKTITVTLYPDDVRFLEELKEKGYTRSVVVRLALKEYKRAYEAHLGGQNAK